MTDLQNELNQEKRKTANLEMQIKDLEQAQAEERRSHDRHTHKS